MSVFCFYRIDVKEPGDYKFCLDNSFSRISKKLVYFELMTDDDDEEDDWKPDKDEIAELVDMTIDDFKVCTPACIFPLQNALQNAALSLAL